MKELPIFTVSDAVGVINQTLEYAYPQIKVVGEVANFKVSGGKWVFFDLKDDQMSLKCFMTAWTLRTVLEDGMKVEVLAKPRLGKYGFSLNIDAVKPVGEGDIKKAFELLRAKLDQEGLFALSRKRPLPELPERIGVISSREAAGYEDFLKILSQRFGGVDIIVADTAVQGDTAADQIIKALKYFNENESPPEVVAILRGGGSRDDLVAFDDELLVRAIASSRVPVITGVGHEIDVTLADLVADVRASTPSNAAEILLPDKREIISGMVAELGHSLTRLSNRWENQIAYMDDSVKNMARMVADLYRQAEEKYGYLVTTLEQVNPNQVLRRGYAIVRSGQGKILRNLPKTGENVEVEIAKGTFLTRVIGASRK